MSAARQHTSCFVTWPTLAGGYTFPLTTMQSVRDQSDGAYVRVPARSKKLFTRYWIEPDGVQTTSTAAQRYASPHASFVQLGAPP